MVAKKKKEPTDEDVDQMADICFGVMKKADAMVVHMLEEQGVCSDLIESRFLPMVVGVMVMEFKRFPHLKEGMIEIACDTIKNLGELPNETYATWMENV